MTDCLWYRVWVGVMLKRKGKMECRGVGGLLGSRVSVMVHGGNGC